MASKRFSVLGVSISAIDISGAIESINDWIDSRKLYYVCVTGVHGVMESQSDPRLAQIHRAAGMVTPDGMPLVWIGKLLGHRQMGQVCGSDLMLAVFAEAERKGHKHFLYGSSQEVLDKLEARLLTLYPNAKIVGAFSPPFRDLEERERTDIAAMIDESDADIVWVGLSTPKQERWMADFRPRLSAPVLIGVGAAFDFHAGSKARAPRFLQIIGMEWAFRLLTEPRRLWRRYLKNNPVFVFLVARAALRRTGEALTTRCAEILRSGTP